MFKIIPEGVRKLHWKFAYNEIRPLTFTIKWNVILKTQTDLNVFSESWSQCINSPTPISLEAEITL